MARILPAVLAGLAVALMLFAMWNMARGELALAGVSFLSASIVIFLRETSI
jgi:hypothetical protein